MGELRMKVKLFSAHRGISTYYVLARGMNDAYEHFKKFHVIKSKITKVANVEATFDQMADIMTYKHDRKDLPETFGKNVPVSDKVYSKIVG
jgi:hypothetical protein